MAKKQRTTKGPATKLAGPIIVGDDTYDLLAAIDAWHQQALAELQANTPDSNNRKIRAYVLRVVYAFAVIAAVARNDEAAGVDTLLARTDFVWDVSTLRGKAWRGIHAGCIAVAKDSLETITVIYRKLMADDRFYTEFSECAASGNVSEACSLATAWAESEGIFDVPGVRRELARYVDMTDCLTDTPLPYDMSKREAVGLIRGDEKTIALLRQRIDANKEAARVADESRAALRRLDGVAEAASTTPDKTTAELPDRDAPTPANDERPAHSIDFRSVNWFGTLYTFTEHQAACVKILWQHWQQGTPDVGGKTLLTEIESDAERIDIVFRDHPAWNTMIVKGVKRGTRRLQEPARPKNDT